MNDSAGKPPKTLAGAKIYFTDGTVSEFVLTRDDTDVEAITERLTATLKSGMISLHLNDGRLSMMPTHNIKRIDVRPASPVLPEGTVTNIREL